MVRRGKRLLVRAPAKINLYLEVLGARSNGYHDIRSVVIPVDVCDEILLEETDGDITIVTKGLLGEWVGPSLPTPEENLATRAAVLLKKVTDYKGGVRIILRKNIPVGGGLGGGSADAAAVLTGLNQLWNRGLTKQRLSELGARLGSDVPALVEGRAVLVEGIGEKVTPIWEKEGTCATWWTVLVNPQFGISTRDIYERFEKTKSFLTSVRADITQIILALKKNDVEKAAVNLFNDLQDTVVQKYPLIGIILEEMKKAGALGVLVSGSGSSVFGLAKDDVHAKEVEKAATRRLGFPLWSKVARTLPDGVTVAHGPLEARV